MKISYDELYAKLPDTIGRPVRVANPDPLHNNTKISDNGTYDVSSFAVAKIDVEGGGGGGGANLEPLSITITHNDDTNEYSANKSYQNFRQEWVDAIRNSNLEYTTDISKLNYPCTVTVINTEDGEPYDNHTYDGAIINSSSQNSNDQRALFIAFFLYARAVKDNNDEYYMCINPRGVLFYQHEADDVIEGYE